MGLHEIFEVLSSEYYFIRMDEIEKASPENVITSYDRLGEIYEMQVSMRE